MAIALADMLSEVVTTRQAAALLGISLQRVDVLVSTGRLPYVRSPGRIRLLDRAAVETMAAARAAAPKDALGRVRPKHYRKRSVAAAQ